MRSGGELRDGTRDRGIRLGVTRAFDRPAAGTPGTSATPTAQATASPTATAPVTGPDTPAALVTLLPAGATLSNLASRR